MSDALWLAAGVLLPWAAGFALIRALFMGIGRRGRVDFAIAAGYGHLAGVLLVTFALRITDAMGIRLAFAPTAIALTVIAILSLAFARHRQRAHECPEIIAPPDALPLRWLAFAALALIAVRAGTLTVEVLMRPLYAWDAWSQWATKAKVWSGLREIVPFIGYDQWLARAPGYTDTAPHYPGTIPLLQTWMTLALGRWDDALMNIPWLAAFAALGLGVYGQMRALGASFSWATITVWLVLSLPLLNAHVALPGYADLHLASAYALGLLALARWEESRERGVLVLLVASGALLPLLKLPGIAWLATLVFGWGIAALGSTPWRVAGLAAGVAAVSVAAVTLVGPANIASDPGVTQFRIVESLARHLFAFGNWNLLWYLAPVTLLLAWREAIALKATTLALFAGFGFLAWAFLFTRAGNWVVDYTTVNRALLHIAPALTVFCALIAYRRCVRSNCGSDLDLAPRTSEFQ